MEVLKLIIYIPISNNNNLFIEKNNTKIISSGDFISEELNNDIQIKFRYRY